MPNKDKQVSFLLKFHNLFFFALVSIMPRTGRYLCSVCQLDFKWQSSLCHHFAKHHKNITFKCPHCNLKFSRNYLKRRHISKCPNLNNNQFQDKISNRQCDKQKHPEVGIDANTSCMQHQNPSEINAGASTSGVQQLESYIQHQNTPKINVDTTTSGAQQPSRSKISTSTSSLQRSKKDVKCKIKTSNPASSQTCIPHLSSNTLSKYIYI
ncbi:MAG: hypothetical protein AAGM46_26065 [Cyanobacteria bacterium J06582_2]